MVMCEDPLHPILVVPIGPFHGIFEIASAAEVVMLAKMSGLFSPSTDKTVTITWTSFFNAFGKKGRIERSIIRAVKIASSDGLPSLFTQRLPFILPPA